jgi:hypothetical protein
MGHWEDFWWNITESIKNKGLKKEFDDQLKKMDSQEKHRYKDIRDKWDYAYHKVVSNKEKNG